jgi:hypothetical protein
MQLGLNQFLLDLFVEDSVASGILAVTLKRTFLF